MKILKKLIFLLTNREKKLACILLIMILVMALLDMVGVASIMPFIAVLSNPDIVDTNIFLKKFADYFKTQGIDNKKDLIFILGIFTFLLLLFSLFFKAFTMYLQLRFTQMRQYSIGRRLVEGYLHQPYSWFLNRHSAGLGKSILSEVDIVVAGGLNPVLNLFAQIAVTLAILVLLILIDPKLTLIVGISLSVPYILIYQFVQNYISKIGQGRKDVNNLRFTVLSEAFGATKEVKIGGLEEIFIKRFSDPARTYAKYQVNAQLISKMPRFALEAIAFGGMLLVTLYIISQSGTFAKALPIIAVYAFAGYRLMPALQQIYNSITQLRYVGPALDDLYFDLKNLQLSKNTINKEKGFISVNKSIILKNVDYSYPNISGTTLKNISVDIPACSTVGFVGSTGSGKTTTIDLILGLIEPKNGTLEVDGKIINKQNSRLWQNSIGYVPQHIFLADDTISANIAFGVNDKDINQDQLEKASKIANLHDFVMNELPMKYETKIGERGVRLSGGQRQRIGIARALYHKPQVLVFDEATSSLDNVTEQNVMNAVNKIGKDLTIIIIAHRLSTVKKCDKIFLLEKGELIGQGTFEELVQFNENFRKNSENL